MNSLQTEIQRKQNNLNDYLTIYDGLDAERFKLLAKAKYEEIIGDSLIMDDNLDILESVSYDLQDLDEDIRKMALGETNTNDCLQLLTSVQVSAIWHNILENYFLIED